MTQPNHIPDVWDSAPKALALWWFTKWGRKGRKICNLPPSHSPCAQPRTQCFSSRQDPSHAPHYRPGSRRAYTLPGGANLSRQDACGCKGGEEGGEIFLALVVNTTCVPSNRDSFVEVAQRGRAEDVAHLLPKYSSTAAAVHAAQPYVHWKSFQWSHPAQEQPFPVAWAVSSHGRDCSLTWSCAC